MRKKILKTVAVCTTAAMLVSTVGCGKEDSVTTSENISETPDIVFTSIFYNEKKGIVALIDREVDGDVESAFKVIDGDGNEVSFSKITVVAGTNLTFSFSTPLDATKEYYVVYGNVTQQVKMPSPYSTDGFESKYTYSGNDLGATYTSNKTTFRVWAPTAENVKVNLYESGDYEADDLIESIEMTKSDNGTFVLEKSGDLDKKYYTYTVVIEGKETEACDPYARATGVNGKRAMVIDLDSTDPEGWDTDANPNAGSVITDAIIYELHLRDISADESSGITNKGKYLGLTETGTATADGIPTGLDYIKDLGVNYVHIMPMYDYGSVDETKLDEEQYNWGYDPVNYNVPEGSYSTDPYHGEVRVKEAKQMVKTLHDNNISVIMDVVYNHVYDAEDFCFNNIVPGYFSRISDSGVYSSGSGCGNDTATERSMVRKYIVDSVLYWADEYHIDGFRFDLVGLIDTTTINSIIEEVHKTHPDIIFYGEGWNMNTQTTKNVKLATQANAALVPKFAFFNDYFRDTVRGSNSGTGAGYGTGEENKYLQLSKMLQGRTTWSSDPLQIINYAACHDNNTLFDKIGISYPNATLEEKAAMTKLTAAITLMSQGTPFIHNGEEILRTKTKDDGTVSSNSYNLPDSVNSIKYDTLSDETYQNVYEYYKGLIAFRKAHKGLCMTSEQMIKENFYVMDNTPDKVVACLISGGANGESSDGIFMAFNGTDSVATVTLPEGVWKVCVNDEKAGTETITTATGSIEVKNMSCVILVK